MRRSIKLTLASALVLTMMSALPAASATPRDPDDVVAKAAKFLGGVDALMGLEGFAIDATGLRWVLDEGFIAGEGATGQGTFDADVTYDVDDDGLRLDYEISAFGFDRVVSEVVNEDLGYIDGDFFNGAPPGTIPMLSDRLVSIRLHQKLLNPHVILREILEDPGLVKYAKQKKRGKNRIHILGVEDGRTPLRIVMNGNGRIKKITTWESDPLRRDVKLKVKFTQWQDVGGLRFPSLVTVWYDGEIVHAELRKSVAINPDIDPAVFEIPSGLDPVFDEALAARGDVNHQYLQSFAALGFPRDGFQRSVEGTELAPGVWWVTGGTHHSLAVVHDDGVVIAEGPLDEVRTDAVTEWVKTTFPGKAITHAVSSHHHSDHSAGLRRHAANGVGIVMHEAAVSFFEDVFAARSRIVPDGLTPSSPRPRIVAVPADELVTVIDGTVPVNVYPFLTEHAEDLVLVEAGGVLFVVDIFSPGFGPVPPVVAEIIQFVEDNGLDIDWVAGGHGGIVAWEDLVGA